MGRTSTRRLSSLALQVITRADSLRCVRCGAFISVGDTYFAKRTGGRNRRTRYYCFICGMELYL